MLTDTASSTKALKPILAFSSWFIIAAMILLRSYTILDDWHFLGPFQIILRFFLIALGVFAIFSCLKKTTWRRSLGLSYFIVEIALGMIFYGLHLAGVSDTGTIKIGIIYVFVAAGAAISLGDPYDLLD